MKNKIKTILALLAAFCGLQLFTATPAFAENATDELGKTPKHWYKFNGNLNSDGSTALSIGGENGSSYVDTKDGKAYKFSESTNPKSHPYGTGMSRGSGDYTVVTVAKLANLTRGIVWSMGTSKSNRGYALIVGESGTKIGVRRFGSDSSWQKADIISVSVPDAMAAYHVYTLVYTSSDKMLKLYIDDSSTAAGSATLPDNSFSDGSWQFGSLNGGTAYDMVKGLGVCMDDFRLYQEALTTAQIAKIYQDTFKATKEKAYLWLDASDSSTITLADGKVTEWRTRSNSGKKAVSYTQSTQVTAGPSVTTGALNDKNVVNFGTVGSHQDLKFDASTNIRAIFMVADIDNSGDAFILGGDTTSFGSGAPSYHFHRDGSKYFHSSNSSQYLRDGQIRRNRTAKAYSDNIGTGYGLITLIPTAGVNASRICEDREEPSRNGGKRIAELIIFTSEITNAQRDEIETYLMDKWFPNAPTPTNSLGFDNNKNASSVLGGTALTGTSEWDDGVTYTKVRGSDSNYAVTISSSSPKFIPYASSALGGMTDSQSWSVHASMKLAEVENAVMFSLSPAVWSTCKYIGVEYVGNNQVRVVYGSSGGAANKKELIAPVTVTDSKTRFHSYLLTFNASASGTAGSPYYTLYVDGVKAGDSGTIARHTGYASGWCIGNYFGDAKEVPSAKFDGAQIDDFAVWGSTCLTAMQARDLAGTFPIWEGYKATASGTCNWTGLSWNPAWPSGGGPGVAADITVGEVAATTLTINENETMAKLAVTSAAGNDFTLAKGDGVTASVKTYDFSNAAGKTTVNYGTGTTPITAGSDTVLTVMGNGNVSVATGKTVTVPGGWTTPTKVTGAGDVKIAGAEKSTAITWGANGITGKNILTCGTWAITAGDQYIGAKPFWIRGANAVFKISGATDILYNASGNTNPISVEDGGEFHVYDRDTCKRAITLSNGGKMIFDGDNGGGNRAFDFYESSSLTVSGSTPCVIGGLTAGSTTASGIIAIRRSDFTVTVNLGAELQCYSAWKTEAGSGGNFIKAGDGKLVQYRDSTSALPFAVNAGTLKFVNGGRTTTAGITLNDGMKLELSATGDGSYTLGNVISGAGRVEKQDSGTYTLSGANTYSGGTTVKAGTLIVTTPNGDYTVDGGTLTPVNPSETSEITVNQNGTFSYAQDISAGGTFAKSKFVANAGTVSLTVTMSKAQVQAEPKTAIALLGSGITATTGFDVTVLNADTGNPVENELTIEDNVLYVTPQGAQQTLTYTPTESGSFTWEVGSQIGAKKYRDYDNITFATTVFTNTVNAPSKIAATRLTVGGTYNFTGSMIIASLLDTTTDANATFANDVIADSAIITNGTVMANSIVASEVAVTNATFGAKVLGPSMKYVRLTITAYQSGSESPAVAEFRLYRGSATTGYTIVDWPVGTKISDNNNSSGTMGNTVTKETAGYPGAVGTSNEGQPGCLIDGVYGNSTTNTTIYAGGGQVKNNKWWPTKKSGQPWIVQIEFPDPVAMFSGCNFCLADHAPRNPTAWTIEVSSDGENWTTVNTTSGATWTTQNAWNGGNENVPAFLNTGTTPTDVKVGTGSTIVADGNWTAALEVGGNVTFKGVAGANLTLDAASTSKFDTVSAKLTFDLREYDVSQAGKQYVIAGPTAGWPETSAITVIPESFKLFKDGQGYYVQVVSGNYWLGDNLGIGTWDLNKTAAWGTNSTDTVRNVWLNGGAAFFTRNGTVTIDEGVLPTAINITSNDNVDVTFKGVISALANVPIAIGSTNDTLTIENADAFTLPTVTAVADSTPKFVKTGAGTLTVNSGNQFAGGAVVVSNGTLLVGSTSAFTGLGTLTAEGAGVIDVNGKALTRAFTLGTGGSLVNNGNSIGNGSAQMNTLTLTGNASVGGSGNFGLITNNYNASSLNLGAYTLTKTGANSFWLCNTTINGAGTIQIDAGTLAVSDNSGAAKTTTFADGTISVGASGTLQVDSNKTLTLGKLSMTTGATITNNGTINGLKELTDADLTAVGGTLGFHADGVTVKGTVKISDGKFGSATVIVADEAKIDLAIDASAYEATITTGTLTFPQSKGVADCVTINGSPATTWKILENGKIYDSSRLAYYAADVTATSATWSTKTGLTKTSTDDWANGVRSTITLASLTADAELTFDVATTAAVLKVTGAENLTLKKGQDIDVQIASIDLTEATGRITIDFNPGAATIKTGVDTVLNAVGTGNITIGTDHVLTVKGSGLTASKVTNSGTIAFNGGNAETPLAVTGDGNFGVTTLGENTYVKNTVNGNHKHLVTGEGASSHYALTGKGFADGSAFTNLTLVACGSESLWIERGIGENVRLEVLDGQSATIGNDSLTYNAPFIALNGSGEVKSKHDSTLTINCTEAATYSGTSSIGITIGACTAEQQFTGNYTGALTVNEGGQAALKVGATYAINVNNAGTLRLIDNETPQTTLTAATFNNTGTLNLSGTGINTLAIGTLTSFGTVTWPAEVAGTVKITSGGATRDFTEIKTKLSGFSGAVELDITETLAENAAGQVALTGAPANAKIVLTRIDGSVIEGSASAEGAFTQKVDVLAYGAACLFDYTFTNTVVVAAGSRNKDYALQFDKGISPIYSETEDSMLLYCSPWIQMNNLMYSLDTFSVAMYGKVSATNNTFFISFGSGTQSHMLFLASNADGTKVDVVYYDGTNHQLSQIEVPNMTTASHLYVFSKTSARDLYIYLDGALWQHVVSPVDLVMGSSTHSGVQFGSGFGTRPSPYDRVPSTDTTADVGTLRVYDYVVSEKQLAALKTDFPYSSPDTYARTVDTATTNWVSAAAWTKKTETFDAPDAKGAVKVTADADTTVSVNLGTETAVNYEKVTFDGKESISLVLAEGNTIPVKAMQFEFETDVTVTPESIDLGSAQTTTIGANGKLTIDLRGIDCGAYTTNFVKEITGTCTDSELVSKDKLAIIKPTEMYGRDMTIIYQSNNKYAVEVALKSDVTAMYWKPTETVLTNTTHLTDSTGTADYIWWQTMPITVGQDNTAALTSITGDCQNTVFLVNSGVAFDIGTVRTAKIGGAGSVKATLTENPEPGDVVTVFTVASGTPTISQLKKPKGDVIDSTYYTYANGVVTFKKEAAVGTQYYFTLKQAIEEQKATATIELVKDIIDAQSITVGQNITLEGDTNRLENVMFSGSGTLVLNSGCIGIDWSERLSVTNGICRFAESVTNSWASHGPAEYSIAKLSTPVRADTTYQYEFVKSGFVPDPAKGEELIPVVDQNGNDAGAIKLNSEWVATVTGKSDPTQQAIALNTKETNKLMKWQNDVLGLTGSEEKSKPVPTPQQTADAAHLDFKLGGVNVAAGSGATVKYRVLAADTPGASLWTQTGGISNYTETVRVDLPKSGVKYYKLDVITETSK